MDSNAKITIKALLGFAIKAGKIIYGADNIEASRKSIYLILGNDSLSERAKAALKKTAVLKKAKLFIMSEELEEMVYKTNCKAVAILDKNMADAISKHAEIGGGILLD